MNSKPLAMHWGLRVMDQRHAGGSEPVAETGEASKGYAYRRHHVAVFCECQSRVCRCAGVVIVRIC